MIVTIKTLMFTMYHGYYYIVDMSYTSYLFCLLQTLYTYPDSFRASKVLIAAQYSGASIRVVSEPPEFVLGETNKTQQFLSKFPLGKVRSKMRKSVSGE